MLKIALAGAAFFLIIILLLSFFGQEEPANQPTPLDTPSQKAAELSINNFHHTATREGKTQWRLEARSAEFLSEENRVRLTDIHVVFFLHSSPSQATLTADKGILNLNTNDMAVSGHVTVDNARYQLKTETLQYNRDSHIISSQNTVHIVGPAIQLTADALKVNLATGTLECRGHVKGTIDAAENL